MPALVAAVHGRREDKGEAYMPEGLIFGRMKTGEENYVSDFVSGVFKKYVAPDYPKHGINEFMSFIKPQNLLERIQKEGHFIITAKDDNKIVGVIGIRDMHHISLLFVDEKYQGKGIGKKLISLALEKILIQDECTKELTVYSSPYAKEIYKKMGFTQDGPKQEKNGIIFIPLRMELK